VIQLQWAFVGFRRTREIVVGIVVVFGCVIDCHVLRMHVCIVTRGRVMLLQPLDGGLKEN
jgi:hypothetical protein